TGPHPGAPAAVCPGQPGGSGSCRAAPPALVGRAGRTRAWARYIRCVRAGRNCSGGGSMSTPVLWICGILVVTAVMVAVFRVERGPSMLDRIVALDVVIAALIGTTALWSAATGRVDLVPLLTVMALIGFVASVTLARFAAIEPEDEGRTWAEQQIRELEAAYRARAADDEEDET